MERHRIAGEVHAMLAQDLAAIRREIESALSHLGHSPAEARLRLERALTATRDSLDSARQSVLDLREGLPAGRSLQGALGELSRSAPAGAGIEVTVRVAGPTPLPFRVEVGLYRIVQQWLAAVRRQPRVTLARIELAASATEVRLLLSDDGYRPDAGRYAGRGFWAIDIREQVVALAGFMQIDSRLGAGTSVSVRVPVRPARSVATEDGRAVDFAAVSSTF
jgi:two-component system sensor histidine kinase UhpB